MSMKTIEELRTIYCRCLVPKEIFDSNGYPTGRFFFDSEGAIKALEMIGNRLGMFVD